MSTITLKDSLVRVGLDLRNQYLESPLTHLESEEFKRAYQLAEEISF